MESSVHAEHRPVNEAVEGEEEDDHESLVGGAESTMYYEDSEEDDKEDKDDEEDSWSGVNGDFDDDYHDFEGIKSWLQEKGVGCVAAEREQERVGDFRAKKDREAEDKAFWEACLASGYP